MPDFPVYSDWQTSSSEVPRHDQMPIPVMTTRFPIRLFKRLFQYAKIRIFPFFGIIEYLCILYNYNLNYLMHLAPSLSVYTREQLSARQAQRLAEFIDWKMAPEPQSIVSFFWTMVLTDL